MTIDIGTATAIAALLAFISAIVVAVINSKAQTKAFLAELDKQNALVVYRLEQLEKELAAFNDFRPRLVALEQQVKTLLAQQEDYPK